MWVRGLKHVKHYRLLNNLQVAPYVGAWIETMIVNRKSYDNMSHPMWVRGLKLPKTAQTAAACPSHPMWVRGLKPSTILQVENSLVAPYVGAWIETTPTNVT